MQTAQISKSIYCPRNMMFFCEFGSDDFFVHLQVAKFDDVMLTKTEEMLCQHPDERGVMVIYPFLGVGCMLLHSKYIPRAQFC